MTRFLHITDLHLDIARGAGPEAQPKTVGRLTRLVNLAATMRPAPAFVVASGDLVNRGDVAAYRLLHGMLAALPCPVVLALGNHDRRRSFRAVFPGHPGGDEAPLDHQTAVAGMHVIALDSSRPGHVAGDLSEAQLAFLATALTQHPDLPKLLVVHHPPMVGRGGAKFRWATLPEDTSARLRDSLTGHRIAGVLSGHVHYNRVSLWHGIPVVLAAGHQSVVDLAQPGGLTLHDASGFAICDMLDGGLSVAFQSLDPPDILKHVPEDRLTGRG